MSPSAGTFESRECRENGVVLVDDNEPLGVCPKWKRLSAGDPMPLDTDRSDELVQVVNSYTSSLDKLNGRIKRLTLSLLLLHGGR